MPLLIDCLDDGRLTNVRFHASGSVKSKGVPLGYVCLDILTGVVPGEPISDPDCDADGLGACVNRGFYFRPDDYITCTEQRCIPRAIVAIVQRNWRRQFLRKRLKFYNPYDNTRIEQYKEFATPRN